MTKITGIRPEDILSDEMDRTTIHGVSMRKGSVAATLANIDIETARAGKSLHTDLMQSIASVGKKKGMTMWIW